MPKRVMGTPKNSDCADDIAEAQVMNGLMEHDGSAVGFCNKCIFSMVSTNDAVSPKNAQANKIMWSRSLPSNTVDLIIVIAYEL